MTKPCKCSCIICHKEVTAKTLTNHIREVHIKICLCGNEIPSTNKFCSHSCSTSEQNRIRADTGWKLSTKSKIKISISVAKSHLREIIPRAQPPKRTMIHFLVCKECGVSFVSRKRRKTCSDLCHRHSVIKNGIRTNRQAYNGTWFDSSWEVTIAKKLDELGIAWVKPIAIPWVDSDNKSHKYYADFFLPNFNIYLDPKNPHRIKQDTDKLVYLKDKVALIYGDVNMIIQYLEGLPGIEPGLRDS